MTADAGPPLYTEVVMEFKTVCPRWEYINLSRTGAGGPWGTSPRTGFVFYEAPELIPADGKYSHRDVTPFVNAKAPTEISQRRVNDQESATERGVNAFWKV